MLSSANTHGLLQRALVFFFGPLDRHTVDLVNVVLRKIGHFVGYATLCLLFFRAVFMTAPALGLHRLYFRWLAICSVLFTAFVAAVDELHQTRLASRTGRFHDVILDTAGAVFVLLVLMAVVRKRSSALRQMAADVKVTETSADVEPDDCKIGCGGTHPDITRP